MKIALQYFSIYRSRFGCAEVVGDYPEKSTVREIFFSHFPDAQEAVRHLEFTRFAVNAEYVPHETVLKEGDELVFIPPVSGG